MSEMTSNKKILSIDLETKSEVDIINGVYRYVEGEDFEILLCSYAYDDEPVQRVNLGSGETLPEQFLKDIQDPAVEKHAFNASFERICLSRYLGMPTGTYIDPSGWWCTQAHAAMMGLPSSLDKVAKALELDEQKDSRGKYLINYFSKPCKPTAKNGYRTWNRPEHDPGKWALFGQYCDQDVVTERAISKYVTEHYPFNLEEEKKNYQNNERINDRGVPLDIELCRSIAGYNARYMEVCQDRLKELTGLDNPNSRDQLIGWLASRGVETDKLTKTNIGDLIDSTADPEVQEVLELRLDTNNASIKKYERMLEAVCSDGTVKGCMKWFGASRSGRWSSKIVQFQNMTKPHMKELDEVRNIVRNGDWDYMETMYDSIHEVFKELLRTALKPDGQLMTICDYSAIECRVLAWLAGEQWVLNAFHEGQDIYCATASQMFGIPVKKNGVNGEYRQRGKVATLACGYGGGVNAMRAMDYTHELSDRDEEVRELVTRWRDANPHIVQYWSDVERAARMAIAHPRNTYSVGAVWYKHDGKNLYCRLPNGRVLVYYDCKIQLPRREITYMGTDAGAWCRLHTHGGKLTENITQATAACLLSDSINRMLDDGIQVVFHVHDEIIAVVPEDRAEEYLQRHISCMTQNAPWSEGLEHPAPGFISPYYTKD